MQRLVHLVHTLEVGGLERVVLDLAARARREGLDHRIVLIDRALERDGRDFDPGDVPCELIQRGPGLDLRFVRRLRAHLRGNRVDVVHAHNDTPIAYAALAGLPRARGVPALAATFHTLPSHGGRAARALTRWATARAAARTSVSAELAARLESSGWSRPLQVIENGVDLDVFRPARDGESGVWRARLRIARGAFLAACIARYVPGKRHEDLITAFDVASKAIDDAHLLCAGSGPSFEALRERASTERVRILAPIADVAGLLREIDALVLCSDHEAHPRIVLEALASGVPCVVTSVGEMPAIVGAGEGACGIVVPPRDPRRLAQALVELARDRSLRARLARSARARAADFSFERHWSRYVDLWSSISRR